MNFKSTFFPRYSLYEAGPSPTLKDQRGLFLEISNPLLVGIPNKSAVGLHSLKDEVIQF